MNRFGPKSDLSRCGHVARRGPRLKLKQKGETRVGNQIFLMLCTHERERREKEEG